MRLIDADALKESIKRQADICRAMGNEVLTEYADLIQTGFSQEIDNAPTIQLEIIRCKDCKWFNDIGCAIRIVDDSDKPKENDFCSFAERRTDG